MSSNHLKEAYEAEASYGAFYTGGQVEWSHNGDRMFCQCGDAIKIVELSTGLTEWSLGDPEEGADADSLYCFALSRDGRRLASAHKSGLIRCWTPDDHNRWENKCEKMWRSVHRGPISRLAFDAAGEILATGGSDGSVRLWDVARQTCSASLKGAQGVFGVLKFHPDASTNLIFGSADDTKIIAWDTSEGEQTRTYSGHFSKVTSLDFTLDGGQMVSSGRDRVIILWDVRLGKAVRTLPVYESLEGCIVMPIKFQLPGVKVKKSDGGVYVACGGETGVLKVWEVTTSRLVFTQTNSLISAAEEAGSLAIARILLNEVRSCISIISADHNIMVYDLATFECNKQMVGFTDEVLDLTLFGKDDSHAAVATNSKDIKIYEMATMNCQIVKGHQDLVLSLSKSSHNPNILLSSGKDNTIRVWLMGSEKQAINCIAIGTRHTSSVGSVCMPFMDISCCFSVSQDSCVKRWKLPDILNATDEPLKLTSTHTEIAHSKDINFVTISPNDRIVATASQDKTIKLWAAEDLGSLGTLRGHKRGVWCVKFSPVDQVLLSTSADCTIKLWSLTELNCLKTLEGHGSSVLKAEFLSKGLQIVSAGADGLLKIWSIKTSESILSLDKHDGRVWALAVSQSESCILTGGADSLLVKWKDVTIEKKEREAKEREELILQEQELSNLLHEKKLVKALKLSLKLEKPFHALKIINELLKDEDKTIFNEALDKLNPNQKQSLIKCCIEWNTNSKNCHVAQIVLHALLSEGGLDIKNAESIRSLLPYTQRHMQRVTSLLQDLQFLTFTVNCMHATKMN